MRSRARRTSSTELSDRVVATVTSYDRVNLRRPGGVSRAMRGSSVLALAAAREDDRKHGKRQKNESFHGVKYGRIAAAVLFFFFPVSILVIAGAAAASRPQVVTKSLRGTIRAVWPWVSGRSGSPATVAAPSSGSIPGETE
jgi:hypothetical protein